MLSETWFSANIWHDVHGYTGFQTYCVNKTGGGVSLLISNFYALPNMAIFSLCHAYYEISEVKISLLNNCAVIIICVDRPPDKSKIFE